MNRNATVPSARLALVGAAAALALALAPVPALALSAAPAAEQSLPASIDASIPDDATLISSEYALLESGEVVSVADGSVVEGADLLGTPDAPPDPLDVTGGERFAQMSVGEARQEIAESGVQLLGMESNYGSYWGSYQGQSAFFMSNGSMFACQAIAVVDVSEHNGTIDWEAAKAYGVQGAIIRIGFGYDRLDYTVERNVRECERLGIPYGIYLYSYAETPEDGRAEGRNLVSWLRQLGIEPGDLDLPVYYDLEEWVWTGHQPPTDPAVYEQMVRAWMEEVQGAGYTNAGVYSYRSYLYGPLNSSYIHQHTSWAAEYGPTLGFTDFGDNFRGWQYTSEGRVAGFAGNVDLNAFGNATWVNQGGSGGDAAVPPTSDGIFPDVSSDLWCADAVEWAYETGLMGGYDNGNFGPAKTLKRGELAQMLYNRAGKPSVDGSGVVELFSDCGSDDFYASAVVWCQENGYMRGYGDGKFGPTAVMTREQLATVLWRMNGSPKVSQDLSSYPDASSISEGMEDAMKWAVKTGAIKGTEKDGVLTLNPRGRLDRAQAATIFMRLFA